MVRFFGVVLFWVLLSLLLVASVRAQPCTHYASPSGEGNGLTEGTPFQIASFWAVASPGKVLCLLDGTYTSATSVIFPTVSGVSGNPLTVRAMNDGAVSINAAFNRRPLDLSTNYITVKGINFRNGNDTTCVIRGNQNIVQRFTCSSDAEPAGDTSRVVDMGVGVGNLLEDCAVFGRSRVTFAIGARGGVGPNIVRRCWVRHEGHNGEVNALSIPYEIGYDQDNVTVENLIVTADKLSYGLTEPQPLLAFFSSQNSALLGSLVYYPAGAQWDNTGLGRVYAEDGTHAQDFPESHCTRYALVRDVIGYAASGYGAFATTVGVDLTSASCMLTDGSNIADNIVNVAGTLTAGCTGSAWTCTNFSEGTTIAEAIGAGVSMWDRVPGFCRRFINRTLTNQGLWPWPMNQRIQDALVAAGRSSVDITALMISYFGAIPAGCQDTGGHKGAVQGPRVPIPGG